MPSLACHAAGCNEEIRPRQRSHGIFSCPDASDFVHSELAPSATGKFKSTEFALRSGDDSSEETVSNLHLNGTVASWVMMHPGSGGSTALLLTAGLTRSYHAAAQGLPLFNSAHGRKIRSKTSGPGYFRSEMNDFRNNFNVICPSSLARKNILLRAPPNHPYKSRHPVPLEGRWPSSRTLGRVAVDAAASGAWWCSQGGP